MKVFRKESKFKDKDGKKGFWFTGTNKSGVNVVLNFQDDLKNNIPKGDDGEPLKAFVVTNIKGQQKKEQVVLESGEMFENAVYYVKSCDFSEIPNEELED